MNYLKNDFFQKIIVPKIKELDFDNKNLEELPPLGIFKNLFRLQANNNQLKKLPVLPPSLKYLSIRNNQIEHLPSKLPDKLITLDFSNNNIYKLPKELQRYLPSSPLIRLAQGSCSRPQHRPHRRHRDSNSLTHSS